jgi:hypothetical protein
MMSPFLFTDCATGSIFDLTQWSQGSDDQMFKIYEQILGKELGQKEKQK